MRWLSYLLVCVALVACRSYPYRHDIEGRVIAGDAPVAEAIVQRLNDKGEPYGFDDDYRRVTDADGHFSFVAEGQGASPIAYSPWRIRVSHPEHGSRELEVRAMWTEKPPAESAGAQPCWGYCARDFAIDLRK